MTFTSSVSPLQQKLTATSDMDQQDTIEQIRAALEREKAAVGLLITTAEWLKAVKATPGIRLAKHDARLARATRAQIVGDEGEKYPLLPGARASRH